MHRVGGTLGLVVACVCIVACWKVNISVEVEPFVALLIRPCRRSFSLNDQLDPVHYAHAISPNFETQLWITQSQYFFPIVGFYPASARSLTPNILTAQLPYSHSTQLPLAVAAKSVLLNASTHFLISLDRAALLFSPLVSHICQEQYVILIYPPFSFWDCTGK